MKLISGDRTFIYYLCDRADGKSHGIRIGRTTGAVGFVSETPTAQQTHPIRFTLYDDPAVKLPINGSTMPPILTNVIGETEDKHPEIHDLLSGTITFEQALEL